MKVNTKNAKYLGIGHINEGVKESIISDSIKPYAGNDTFAMFYDDEVNDEELRRYAKNHAMTKKYWASETGYNGIYNGGTYVLVKNINNMPNEYREDAEKHSKDIFESLAREL